MANQKDYQTTLPDMKARYAAMFKELAAHQNYVITQEGWAHRDIKLKVSPKSITVARQNLPAVLFTLSAPKFELEWNEAKFQIKYLVGGKPVNIEHTLHATKVANPIANTARADARRLGYTVGACLEMVAESEESAQDRASKDLDHRKSQFTTQIQEGLSRWLKTPRRLTDSIRVEPLNKTSVLLTVGELFVPTVATINHVVMNTDTSVFRCEITVEMHHQDTPSQKKTFTTTGHEGHDATSLADLLDNLLEGALNRGLAPRYAPAPVAPVTSYMLNVDDVTSTLKNMSTKSGGRMRSVSLEAGPEWHCEPTNRQRLDHTGNDGDGWDEDEYDEEYSNPLYRQVMDKLEDSFGVGLFQIEIGEKGHVYVSLSSKGKQAVKTLRKSASTIVDRWLYLQST